MKKKTAVLQVAATYIGTVIGAGFATGREIVEFFITYGPVGLCGILLCGVFFIWIGAKIMRLAHRNNFHSYEPFNQFLFGKKLGMVVNLLFLLILIGSTSMMVAGTGSVFHEQLRFPAQWGILLILILCFFAALKGLTGIFVVNILVVPIMLSFTFLIAVFTFGGDPTQSFSNISVQPSDSGWLFSALTYVSYNLAMSQAVLIPLGKEIEDEKVLNWGGIWGGAGLTLILLTAFVVLMQLPDVTQFDIPMAEFVKTFGPFIHTLYVIVIFGEIFTTVFGNVFGLTCQLRHWIELPEWVIIFGILFVCYWVSLADFGTLLSFLYRFFSAIGFLVLFYLIFPPLRRFGQIK